MATKVKLTTAEGLELVNLAISKLGADAVLPILAAALPPEKVGRLVLRQSTPLTAAEKEALVQDALPAIPGKTFKEKLAFVVREIRPAFETRARYDEVMAYVAERVIAYLKAKQQGTAAPAGGLDFRLGYGPVNNWRNLGAKAIVGATAPAGIGIVPIEFWEWSAWQRFKDADAQIAAFEKLLDATTKSGQILYATYVNSNLGSGKYGDPGIKLSAYAGAVWKGAARVAELMKSHPRLFVTPVGEGGIGPDPKFDKQVQDWFLANAPKAQLVNNWGARPSGNDGMGQRCVHPSSTKDAGSGTAWVMSDHGLLIRELNGGALYGTADVGVTGSYARKVTDAGRKFIYYHFDQNAAIDANALAALRGVAKPETPAPSGDDVDLSKAQWIGSPSGANAKMLPGTLSNLTIDSTHIRYSIDKVTDSWEPHRGDKKTNQCACFFVMRNGRLTGGRFDDSTWSRKDRETKNIKNGYVKGVVPRSGEDVWFCFIDVGGTVRTNCCKVKWP